MNKDYILNKLKFNDFSEIYHVFQPQLNPIKNSIDGAEILTRWKTKDNIFINPIEFIEIAEQNNLIWLLDLLSLQKALTFVKDNKIKISTNFSIKTLERPTLMNDLSKLLNKYDQDFSFITIEITETVSPTDILTLKKNLLELKKLGFDIFLDDFSIDFANLKALSEYPITGLKIDRSVIKILNSENGKKILYALFLFLETLNVKIVFEGIENAFEVNFLKENTNKNIFIQGFYISKPLLEKDFLTII
ncbi:EAL domain-containing protein [Cetobacterium sp.]|uniref:EAL domain-containing protein n=1 Tax=Cetobacterium sp. TaxID=2071632 RepID=UPI003F32B25B